MSVVSRCALPLFSGFLFVFSLSGSALAVPISIAPDGLTYNGTNFLPFGPASTFGPSGDSTIQQLVNSSAFSSVTSPMLLTSLDFMSAFGGAP